MNKYSKNDISLEILRDSLTEKQEFERKYIRSEAIRKQELLIFSNSKKETATQVTKLQEELKKLSVSVVHLNQEVQMAAIQTTIIETGTYHLTFFEKLISFVKLLTKQVEDSSNWLSMHLARGKKKSHYWGQVKKSGSKYLLSADRYMSTQAG